MKLDIVVPTFVIASLLAACAGGGAPRAASPTTMPAHTGFGPVPDGVRAPLRFARQAVWDPMAGNIQAMAFLVPDGWQAEGSVQWTPVWSRLAHLQTRVTDPATGISIEWLPLQDFIWFSAPAGLEAPIGGNYQGKAYVPPITDPAQFVAQHWMPSVLTHLQSAQLVRIDQVPSVAEEFKRGYGGPAEAGAYRLRYEFDLAGQTWEEDVFFALLFASSSGVTSWFVNFALRSARRRARSTPTWV